MSHPTYGKELEQLAEDLVRRGPAAGIIAILATQRPDAKSLPTGISGNAVLRFCLKVIGHQANDQVLSTGAHKNGVRATIFSRRDLGIGWLSGEDDEPQITRTFYVDNPGAEVIVTRARAALVLAAQQWLPKAGFNAAMTLVVLLHMLVGTWTGTEAACAVPVLTIIAPSVDDTTADATNGIASRKRSTFIAYPRFESNDGGRR